MAGTEIADLVFAEIGERLQRDPHQQQRSDEERSADEVDDPLASDAAGDLVQLRCD